MINWLTENITLRISDLLLGQSVRPKLKFLEESQWWDKEKLVGYQNVQLKKIIRHAYHNVPYYNELFKKEKLKPSDIQSVNDLYKIPLLSKSDVKENFPHKMVARNLNRKKLILQSTSGSTGRPMKYFNTADGYSSDIAAYLRGWYWMGFRLGDKFVKLSQNDRKGIKRLQDLVTRNKYIFAKDLTEDNFKAYVRQILRFQPRFLRSYPDPLLFLVNYAEACHIKLPSVQAINTTGNNLMPNIREKVERAFGCEIFDSYSCEGGAVFFECPTHECYHSSMEYGITEILDNEGNTSDTGKVVLTNLVNYATPFIRYDTQDVMEKSKEPCSCGRQLFSAKSLHGREGDILVATHGSLLLIYNFMYFFSKIEEVVEFQVHQKSQTDFVFYLVIAGDFSESLKLKVLEYCQKECGESANVYVECVDEIPLLKSGKRRFLVRDKSVRLEF